MKTITNFTADATKEIARDDKSRDFEGEYSATIQIGGGFAGGTLTLFVSCDAGTTKNALKDSSGTAYSITAADTIVVRLPTYINAADLRLYGTLAGAGVATLAITTLDNRKG